MFSSSLRSCAPISRSLGARCWTGIQSPSVVKSFSVSIPTEDAIELLQTSNGGQKAVSKKFLPVGAIINEFFEPVESSPTVHTVHFNETTHIAPTNGAEFIKHRCRNTNIKMVADETRKCGSCVVTTEVEKGKDLAFNYNTAEWQMESPFTCTCGFCKTRGYPRYISGFKNLSLEERNTILHDVNPSIRNKGVREVLEHLLSFQEASIEIGTDIYIPTEDAIELVPSSNKGSKSVAKMDLPSGAIINVFSGPIMSSPDMHTVQFNETIHITPTNGAECISHACRKTNTRIVVDEANGCGSCIVTTDVKKGEDLTCNYNATEWHMHSPFICACESCKSQRYPRYISGFKNLSLEERNRIMVHHVSPFIQTKSEKEALKHFQALEEMRTSPNVDVTVDMEAIDMDDGTSCEHISFPVAVAQIPI